MEAATLMGHHHDISDPLGVIQLQAKYGGLRLRPSGTSNTVLEGELSFHARQGYTSINDAFEVAISVSSTFPRVVPVVREIGGRIPRTFHTNPDRTLCLGSPLRLKIHLAKNPTLVGFVDTILIPFLFNFSTWETTGKLPLGELRHGPPGVLADYRDIFGTTTAENCLDFLYLLSLKKRVANKRPCPCGSGLRCGRCHSWMLNPLRGLESRSWFRSQSDDLK
jgi:hypothetical protein